jgi:DNA-binding NarL/FixJ family response regulator
VQLFVSFAATRGKAIMMGLIQTDVSKQIENGTHDVGIAMDDLTRIVIADDHSMVRHAIRQFVETYRGLKVIGEAGNGARAVDLARELRPHIVLMDVHMPVMDGSEAASAICRELPDVKVIGISVDPDMESLMREAGACACVQKADLTTELYPAVCTAMSSR